LIAPVCAKADFVATVRMTLKPKAYASKHAGIMPTNQWGLFSGSKNRLG
jgi:hypothetical protein